jgi:hypothetical protein
VDVFASALGPLVEVSATLSQSTDRQPVSEFARALRSFPVGDSDGSHTVTMTKLADVIVRAEEKRMAVLQELGTNFALPMKQFLRVDVVSLREMQERLEQARQNLDEAQLRYDIARSTAKKKSVVTKLYAEVESCKRQHSLLKVNVQGKVRELESRQRYDALLRM